MELTSQWRKIDKSISKLVKTYSTLIKISLRRKIQEDGRYEFLGMEVVLVLLGIVR